jgi:hypothetical protein
MGSESLGDRLSQLSRMDPPSVVEDADIRDPSGLVLVVKDPRAVQTPQK